MDIKEKTHLLITLNKRNEANTMKKTAKTIIITLISVLIMSMAAVPVSAANIASVSLSKTSATLNVGSGVGLAVSYSYTGKLTANDKKVTWTTSNNKVATVSGGYVKGIKAGTATITATIGGKKATCKVTVKAVKPTWLNTSEAYTYLNNYRKSAKVATLKKSTALENIAKTRAKEMAEKNKFSHTRPNGQSGLTLITTKSVGHTVTAKGENIAEGQTSCKQVSTSWYKSTGHRANMLRKNFKYVGIACYKYNGVTYWAQVFSN